MNFQDQNMAATKVTSTSDTAPPSRPAKSAAKPITLAPGAPILDNEGDQAIHDTQPISVSPDRISPAAMPGDETTMSPQPIHRASRRNSPRKGGSQATKLEAPISNAPDCINPAKAGGIDHALCVTQDHSVDANSSGASRGKGAHSVIETQKHDSPLADHPGEAGRDAATVEAKPNGAAQRHESLSDGQRIPETHPYRAVAGDSLGHPRSATQSLAAGTIAEITQLVRMRRRWHKAEKSLTLQGKALCRSWTNGDKDEANAAYDRAADGKPDDPMLAMALAPFLDAKARFETERGAIEKTLRKLARALPVWKSWAEGVKGLGDLRLAVIVGECGDIGSYRNPSCFWKRMGLAVIGGQRQRRVTDAAEALEHGYNPERRAIAYVMSTELIKAQVRRIKDAPETAPRPALGEVEPNEEAPDAHIATSVAIGPYGQLYLDRKAYEAGREGITKAHANNRAGRYLAKRVLRDLYAAWRAAA